MTRLEQIRYINQLKNNCILSWDHISQLNQLEASIDDLGYEYSRERFYQLINSIVKVKTLKRKKFRCQE